MPVRTAPVVERWVIDDKLLVVPVPANTATDVLPDVRAQATEVAYRELFNFGPNDVFFAYGRDCDNNQNRCATLAKGAMLVVTTMERVSVWCDGGGNSAVIGRTQLRRYDMSGARGPDIINLAH